MLVSLCGYFDMGVSYGLADEAFRDSSRTLTPDIERVGLRNPLGFGLVRAVDSAVLARWREIALQKADDPIMELGFDERDSDAAQLRAHLKDLIRTHHVTAELTIYAVGTAFLRLDIEHGVPLRLVRGFAKCFEYAAYLKPVASALLDFAKGAVSEAGADRYPAIQALSQRPLPKEQYDERGYGEWMLIPSFTYVVRLTDQNDNAAAIMAAIAPVTYEAITFEFHGTLHFNWAACVLEPRDFGDPYETPVAQMERMMWCIEIAHCFLATCEAFESLTLNETLSHADAYIKGSASRSEGRDLNRLRTLALAVNSMTRYEQVTATDEDQQYFDKWERHAKITQRNEIIFNRCEVLYNVQEAEKQALETRRSRLMNDVLFTLTAITLIGFLTGAYDFVRDKEQWLATVGQRAIALFVLGVVLYVASRIILKRGEKRGRPS